MATAKVLVVTGYGTNCERESAYAAETAGADEVVIAHFADLLAEEISIRDFSFIIFPGGFLDGDDLGAAQAAAIRWVNSSTVSGDPLSRQLQKFHARGGLMLGICNGFQLLVKLGLLPALDGQYFTRQCSLSYNDSARFEDRWVHLCINKESPCIFTKDLETLYLPIRHGEGKLIPQDEAALATIVENNLHALSYADPNSHEPTMEYPYNPNGSPLGIAGLTDPTGRIFGLMPHPEAYNHPTNHPSWTREPNDPLGTILIQNGIDYLKSQ